MVSLCICLCEVEINKACVKLSCSNYPNSCVFTDILKMVTHPEADNWSPSKVKLKKTAYCAQHRKECLSLLIFQLLCGFLIHTRVCPAIPGLYHLLSPGPGAASTSRRTTCRCLEPHACCFPGWAN